MAGVPLGEVTFVNDIAPGMAPTRLPYVRSQVVPLRQVGSCAVSHSLAAHTAYLQLACHRDYRVMTAQDMKGG